MPPAEGGRGWGDRYPHATSLEILVRLQALFLIRADEKNCSMTIFQLICNAAYVPAKEFHGNKI